MDQKTPLPLSPQLFHTLPTPVGGSDHTAYTLHPLAISPSTPFLPIYNMCIRRISLLTLLSTCDLLTGS